MKSYIINQKTKEFVKRIRPSKDYVEFTTDKSRAIAYANKNEANSLVNILHQLHFKNGSVAFKAIKC